MRVMFPWRSVFSSGTTSANLTSPAKSVATSLVAFSVVFRAVRPPAAISARISLALTCWPSWTIIVVPWAILCFSVFFPLPSTIIWPVFSTMKASSPWRVRKGRTRRDLENLTTPLIPARIIPAASAVNTPPVWNVRMVNWVPGSPILWAAIIPTASPRLTLWPWAKLQP